MTRTNLTMAIRLAIAEEPELPGAIPDEMYETLRHADKATMEEALRIVVRKTKEGIVKRLITYGVLS